MGWSLSLFVLMHRFPFIKLCDGIFKNKGCNDFNVPMVLLHQVCFFDLASIYFFQLEELGLASVIQFPHIDAFQSIFDKGLFIITYNGTSFAGLQE